MEIIKMSARSLLLRWRQFFSLFLVSAVGIAISLFLLFAVNGMISALNMKAKIYYGGDYHFLGGILGDDEEDTVIYEQFSSVFPDDFVICPRYEYDATTKGELYFDGNSARQRYIKGVEFDKERPLLSNCNFIEGGVPVNPESARNAILISEPIAEQLGCHVGDTLTFLLWSYDGYINTIPLVVEGIFRDSSIFGTYTSYVNRITLSNAAGLPDTHINRIGAFSSSHEPTASETELYQSRLEELFLMYPLVKDKDEYLGNRHSSRFPSLPYALLPLSSNIEDLRLIIDAMYVVTALVVTVLIVIILVGISSTYKVIIMKRINEIGIYKAIGMKRLSIYNLIAAETLLLLIMGSVMGALLSCLLCQIIKLFDLTVIPAFDIFLKNGVIQPVISFPGIFAICAIVIVTTLVAVLFSVRDAVKKMPSEALATTA